MDRPTRVGPLRRSLNACTAEGLVAELVNACAGGAILTAWAIHLHASTFVTGTLLALSQLAQLFQFPAAWTTSLLGHRRACIVLVAASRQVLLPLAALPFLPLDDGQRQAVLLGVAGLSSILGVLGNNAWVSWMSDLVPKRVRGRYFGRRTALCMLGGALASAGAGRLLDVAGPRGLTAHALSGLQILGCVGGVVTTWLMMRQHDPAADHPRAPVVWRRAFVPFRDPSVRGLMMYLVLWNLAVGVAASFFVLHELRNLHMGYTLVALHATAVAAVRMLAASMWGRCVDRLGARPVLVACSFGISSIPFVWLFPTPTLLWPILVDGVMAGVLWCGHSLAIFNLPLAITPRAERPFYLAAFATLTGLSFSLATLAGGLLAELLPDRVNVWGRELADLQVVFALSGVLRLAAAFAALRIEEPASKALGALWTALVGPRSGRLVPAPIALRSASRVDNDNARARQRVGANEGSGDSAA